MTKSLSTIKKYHILANLALALGFIIGLLIYLSTKKALPLLFTTLAGLGLYVYFAYQYKCPNCGTFLWHCRKEKLEVCPNCGK